MAEDKELLMEATGLKKVYKGRTVVHDVCMKVHRGEVVGLLGPNGAGKTTSFYMITGLVQPSVAWMLPQCRCICVPEWAWAILHRNPPFSGNLPWKKISWRFWKLLISPVRNGNRD